MIVVCSKCGAVFEVMGSPDEIDTIIGRNTEHWPSGYKCAVCGGNAVGVEHPTRELLSLAPKKFELEVQEALMGLVAGLGLPEERELGDVKELLVGRTIEDVHGHRFGDRFVVEYIDVSGGLRVFFAGAVAGALVYRVKDKKKFEFAERVSNGS